MLGKYMYHPTYYRLPGEIHGIYNKISRHILLIYPGSKYDNIPITIIQAFFTRKCINSKGSAISLITPLYILLIYD